MENQTLLKNDDKVHSMLANASTVRETNGHKWDNIVTEGGNLCCPSALSCVASCLMPCVWLGSCKTVNENEGMIVLVNGKLAATQTEPGLTCVNPCCTTTRVTTMKQCSFSLPEVKVIDARGNPIIISAIVVYRVKNVVKALLEVENHASYVSTQAGAVLKQIASKYPYEAKVDHEPALKTDADTIGTEMVVALQNKVQSAGVEIINFLLNELSYAPEIAASMLVRQQAEAMVDARTMIVQGAVEIAKNAVDRLDKEGIEMDDKDKAKMVSNLMCIICGDSNVQPTLDLQT